MSSQKTASTLQEIANGDFTPLFKLAELLNGSPKLLSEFIKDPEGIAKREVEYTPPSGFHLHFIDERLKLLPPESDPDALLLSKEDGEIWSRIETRSGIEKSCVLLCGSCNVSKPR